MVSPIYGTKLASRSCARRGRVAATQATPAFGAMVYDLQMLMKHFAGCRRWRGVFARRRALRRGACHAYARASRRNRRRAGCRTVAGRGAASCGVSCEAMLAQPPRFRPHIRRRSRRSATRAARCFRVSTQSPTRARRMRARWPSSADAAALDARGRACTKRCARRRTPIDGA